MARIVSVLPGYTCTYPDVPPQKTLSHTTVTKLLTSQKISQSLVQTHGVAGGFANLLLLENLRRRQPADPPPASTPILIGWNKLRGRMVFSARAVEQQGRREARVAEGAQVAVVGRAWAASGG